MNAAKNPNNRLANGGLGYLIWLYKDVPEHETKRPETHG
jgi:hypothetical protein